MSQFNPEAKLALGLGAGGPSSKQSQNATRITYRAGDDDTTSVISKSVISTTKQRDGKKKIN